MLIRIRSPNGSHRYEVSPDEDVQVLIAKILGDCPQADPQTIALSNQPRGGERLVSKVTGTFNQLGMKHGDLLFASFKEPSQTSYRSRQESDQTDTTSSDLVASTLQTRPSSQGANLDWMNVKELEIDQALGKEDGKIPRKRDTKFCRHGDKSMCDYCMPLEPYDTVYHTEHGIKHLSFHAFLRKLNAATNKPENGASYIPPLEELDYGVAIPCPSGNHASFPAGICSKCQPSAITLQLQPYRMVDHVEFASPALVENLLVFWRRTGCQRFGYLLGRYEKYEQVPMGIKVVVEAVHEPPQQGEVDGIQIGLPWEQEGKMEDLASICGLSVVGMIFTDLTPDDTTPENKAAGKVLYKRHANSFFLSSLETIFAAHQQANNPNSSRFSATGKFSSKFVTCVVTGNLEGGIDVFAYQASDQAVAMVKADMIEASVEPGTVRLKEDDRSQSARYIPDVFYRYKNKYGIDIKENAKPCFPVDYLLVSLTHGFPAVPSPMFCSPSPMPIENRQGLHDQSMDQVIEKLRPVLNRVSDLSFNRYPDGNVKGKGRQQDEDNLSELQIFLSDWHLIAFIDTFGIFDRTDIVQLVNFTLCREANDLKEKAQALFQTGSWQTLRAIAQETGSNINESSSRNDINISGTFQEENQMTGLFEDVEMSGSQRNLNHDLHNNDHHFSSSSLELACPHCTFVNDAGTTDCIVCGLPISE